MNKLLKINGLLGLLAGFSISGLAGAANAQNVALQRADTQTGGAVTEISATQPRDGVVVTSVRDSNNNLRLISWRASFDGTLTRQDTEVAGNVREIASSQARDGFMVTAVRDSNDNLRVISWEVEADGDIIRRDTEVAGTISEVAIARRTDPFSILDQYVATAVRDSDNNLRVISWSVDNNGNLTRRDTEVAGAVSEIAASGYDDGIVTAVRDSNGNLRMISWEIGSNGTLTRRDTEAAGAVSDVAMTAVSDGVVTAVRDSNSNLRVISWGVNSLGNLTRIDTETAGTVSELDIAETVLSDGSVDERVMTAVRDGRGNLRVIEWAVDRFDLSLDRTATAEAGRISAVAVAKASNRIAVTAVRDGRGNLRVISWR